MKTLPALVILLLTTSVSQAGVIVDNNVMPFGKPVLLRAETRGTLFARGGRVVEFLVNGKDIGRSLSGGDGAAYKEFNPPKAGLYKITVKDHEESGDGYLLVVRKGSMVILIDVEGALYEEGPFPETPRTGADAALRGLSIKYPVVYVRTGFLPESEIAKMLGRGGFPGGPVLVWEGGAAVEGLIEQGIAIRALIAGAKAAEEWTGEGVRVLSLDETESAEYAESWDAVENTLLKKK